MLVALSRQVCLLPSLPSCALPSVSCHEQKKKKEKAAFGRQELPDLHSCLLQAYVFLATDEQRSAGAGIKEAWSVLPIGTLGGGSEGGGSPPLAVQDSATAAV